MKVILPFPPSSLSGHAEGHWRSKAAPTRVHREIALRLAQAAKLKASEAGDILIRFRFVPPDNRGDRVNYPNRLKPYIDGIAQAMGVNDKRFLPSYEFAPPEKPGRVEVEISTGSTSGEFVNPSSADSRAIAGLPQ